jgi:hypothetical protein
VAHDPCSAWRDRDPAARERRRRRDEGGARESFVQPRRVPFLRPFLSPFLCQGEQTKQGDWDDSPHRVVAEDGDGAISLRLPFAKFVENNHPIHASTSVGEIQGLEACERKGLRSEI